MVTVKKQIADALEELNDAELKQLAEFLAFLRFRNRVPRPLIMNDQELAELYGEFAEEDRQLAESGLADYAESLAAEDGA